MPVECGAWRGRSVAVLCSGPSMTKEDADACRGLKVIVTNTTFRMAPWADVLFAYDVAWWRVYHREVKEVFEGDGYSMHLGAEKYGATGLQGRGWINGLGNSGACAIALAAYLGAERIIVLGADCSTKDGLHWHGAHDGGLGNCMSVKKWFAQFAKAGLYAASQGAQVINCSRKTALKIFPQISLEDALSECRSVA